ncbi:hypothetical protein BDP55DRAFT_715139 [Colletotrichum godetiae]|uniref:Uncharacterized protein n=1 Tax=Colletotrichum godetiae TaxID=1209918 RepID=A0AAJ0AMD5_9PEZI|nr:uncharacterized protein BDP55DRAFT_715139 [Colletotrichum godetiae]KAK1675914.1 hypothetical protein BDP55DRAFT_715139 [Colletotrichum godetiae]
MGRLFLQQDDGTSVNLVLEAIHHNPLCCEEGSTCCLRQAGATHLLNGWIHWQGGREMLFSPPIKGQLGYGGSKSHRNVNTLVYECLRSMGISHTKREQQAVNGHGLCTKVGDDGDESVLALRCHLTWRAVFGTDVMSWPSVGVGGEAEFGNLSLLTYNMHGRFPLKSTFSQTNGSKSSMR